MRGYAVGKLERQVEKTHTHWRTFLKFSREPRILVNSYSVEREISGSISSVASTLRILKYLRNIGTSFALHYPTLQWHHDDYLSSPISGRRHKKTKAARKQTQQCWELLRACWQWCANRCNNSQQCWDLQCIVGRIQPISLCKLCVMSVRGPNNAGRAVQTDPTLLRYASAIKEQKKCWELLAEKFDRFQTLCNNSQQHATGCAIGRNM